MRISRVSVAALAVSTLTTISAFAADITGAGATFPYPVYAKWAESYKKSTGTGMNYQSIGSGGGIKQITAKTVDFGASDMPLKPEDLEKDGLTQFPTVIGGVVPVVNLPGVKPGQMQLTGPVLADIYLGKITKWNDPAIAKLNPGVKLPDTDITVVHRSDGSGTTFIWSNYLSKVNPEWKSKVGEGTSVNWPVGRGRQGQRRRRLLRAAHRRLDRLRRIRLRAAEQDELRRAAEPATASSSVANADAFKAAAANADWSKAPGFYLILTDQPGKDAWPISGATFILMHKTQDKPENAKEVLKFFNWAYARRRQAGREPRLRPAARQRGQADRSLAGRATSRTRPESRCIDPGLPSA